MMFTLSVVKQAARAGSLQRVEACSAEARVPEAFPANTIVAYSLVLY
jgi:hypothetical protein